MIAITIIEAEGVTDVKKYIANNYRDDPSLINGVDTLSSVGPWEIQPMDSTTVTRVTEDEISLMSVDTLYVVPYIEPGCD